MRIVQNADCGKHSTGTCIQAKQRYVPSHDRLMRRASPPRAAQVHMPEVRLSQGAAACGLLPRESCQLDIESEA